LSLFRSGALDDQSENYRGLGALGPSVLLIRGELDTVLPAPQLAALHALLPGATRRELPGLSHAMLLTHPEVLGPIIADFLTEGEGGATSHSRSPSSPRV
jgi:pimeloyl-ACP methyl ester carboxylesterase